MTLHNKSQIDYGNKVCDRQLRMSFKTERKKKWEWDDQTWREPMQHWAIGAQREGLWYLIDLFKAAPWGTFKLKGLTPNEAKCQAKNTFLKSKNKNSYILFCDILLTFHKKICRAYSIKIFPTKYEWILNVCKLFQDCKISNFSL